MCSPTGTFALSRKGLSEVCDEGVAVLRVGVAPPVGQRAEHKMVKNCLDYCELADRVGFSTVWVTEHHFLEESQRKAAN